MIPHEDKVDVIPPINILIPHGDIVGVITIFVREGGWRILTPHEDKVDVFSPVNILFTGGGFFSCDDGHDDDDDDDDGDYVL